MNEAIYTGRIEFPPGYAYFRNNRTAVSSGSYLGPPKLSADDQKTAKAQSERIANGTSCVTYETAENGYEFEEVLALRAIEHKRFKAAGLPSPYERDVDTRLIEEQGRIAKNDN